MFKSKAAKTTFLLGAAIFKKDVLNSEINTENEKSLRKRKIDKEPKEDFDNTT